MSKPRSPLWARRLFGQATGDLQRVIPPALAQAHLRARNAHDAAEMESLDTYGHTLDVVQYVELAEAVMKIPGARRAKLGRHDVAVLRDAAFYPLRFAADRRTAVERARVRRPVSFQRLRLFTAHGPEPMQPALDPSLEVAVPPEVREAFPDLGEGTKLVVVVYASSVESGILTNHWGYGELTTRGLIKWHKLSRMALAQRARDEVETSPSKVQSVPAPTRSFDDGEMPQIGYPRARQQKLASGDSPSPGPEGTNG